MKTGGLTTESVAAKLRELHGNMAAVARHFGVTRQSVWGFVQSRETLKAVSAECRESMKDHAESALYSSIFKGEAWAVCFYLKTQAKDRGYVERTEHAGPDGGPIPVSMIEVESAGPVDPDDGPGEPSAEDAPASAPRPEEGMA